MTRRPVALDERVSMDQLRETVVREVRGHQSGPAESSVPEPARPAGTEGAGNGVGHKETFRQRLERMPLLFNALVVVHRILKLPARVVYLVQNIDALQSKTDRLAHSLSALHERSAALTELVASLHAKHDATLRSLDAVASDVRYIGADLLNDVASRVNENVVQLHEKTDRYTQMLAASISALAPVLHAGNDLVISRIDGFIMAFPAEEWRLPAYEIMVGHLEPGLVRLMKDTIREGMSVIDVGANVGTYTLLALRAIGSHGKVYSYEPTPRIFSILANNVQVNGFLESGRIDLRQKAVSDGTETRSTFFMKRDSPTHNSLYREAADRADGVDAIEVDTVSLDRDIGVDARIDVVKIDAEGAEPAVLRGMRGIIQRNPDIVIFMEFAPQHLIRAGIDVGTYIDEIRRMGFAIYNVEEPTGRLESVSADTLRSCFSLNVMLRRADT